MAARASASSGSCAKMELSCCEVMTEVSTRNSSSYTESVSYWSVTRRVPGVHTFRTMRSDRAVMADARSFAMMSKNKVC